jgi:hypothetical protein
MLPKRIETAFEYHLCFYSREVPFSSFTLCALLEASVDSNLLTTLEGIHRMKKVQPDLGRLDLASFSKYLKCFEAILAALLTKLFIKTVYCCCQHNNYQQGDMGNIPLLQGCDQGLFSSSLRALTCIPSFH